MGRTSGAEAHPRKRVKLTSTVGDGDQHGNEGEEEMTACQNCRKRKSKCSKDTPCSQCEKLGIDCLYDDRRRPGIKMGAIETLTNRLANLEQMFLGQGLLLKSVLGLDLTNDTARGPNNGVSCLPREAELLKESYLQASRANPNTLDTVREGEQPSRTDDHYTDTNTQLHSDLHADELDDLNPRLPANDQVDTLVEWYFANIHRWIPILHVRHFRKDLEQPDGRERLSTVLLAITSLSLRFARPDTISVKDSERLSLRYRHAVMLRSMNRFSVENLQAMVIIAFDIIGSGRGPSAWSVVSTMARTVEQLRLNAEPSQQSENANMHDYLMRRMTFLQHAESWTEEEQRRRLFWVVFVMDRFCTVATGWNNSISGSDVQRRLPCEGAIWEAGNAVRTPFFGVATKMELADQTSSPNSERLTADEQEVDALGGFAFCIEATETLNLVTNFLLQHPIKFQNQQETHLWLLRFKELDLRLLRWRMFLPEKWRNASVLNADGIMDPNLTLAHITHNTAVIQLHQCAAFPPPALRASAIASLSSSSAETCVTAASEIGTIAQKFLHQSSGITNPQLSFCLFVAGRMLLANAASTSGPPRTAFWTISDALAEISSRWSVRDRNSVLTETLASRLSKRLLDAKQSLDSTRDGGAVATDEVDVGRPVYSEKLIRSRAGSLGPGRTGEQEHPPQVWPQLDTLSSSQPLNVNMENPSPDGISMAFPPLPYLWDETEFSMSGMNAMDDVSQASGLQRIDTHGMQDTGVDWVGSLQNGLPDLVQQAHRVSSYGADDWNSYDFSI
ncbi:fungal-specific transcription factor domain-containing protein [Elsinoe ampelina]|uniref:Fungal-specific transcription factor domain-containing protein n=1 Tax=Elsinoe ampelina TaxID=302913 RepID=A0A6A6G479_9PEZI|nr:fungal-specific transcription factor domain-containing protein [Elsinoe ampelina]